MHNRISEIDYLKCVFILLMVAFHLVYIGDSYPYAKRVVYTFHMPGFLILSGYLARTYDTWKESLRTDTGNMARQSFYASHRAVLVSAYLDDWAGVAPSSEPLANGHAEQSHCVRIGFVGLA